MKSLGTDTKRDREEEKIWQSGRGLGAVGPVSPTTVVAVPIHSDPEAHAGTQHYRIPEVCKMDTPGKGTPPCHVCTAASGAPHLFSTFMSF